jgi:hypothetical protein
MKPQSYRFRLSRFVSGRTLFNRYPKKPIDTTRPRGVQSSPQ